LEKELMARTVKLLQELIQADTTNELGNEIEAANVLISFFREYNIESQIIFSPGGRANLVAKLDNNNESEPIVLLSHLDVVGPGDGKWEYPPFSGVIENETIWGRGTLDTKQLTAMHAAIMVGLKKSQSSNSLNRTIIFIATADEENGSQEGMEFLSKEYPEYFEHSTVFSEGGGFIVNDGGKKYMFYASGEKGTARVRLKSTGEGGHAGAPPTDQALLLLVSGLTSLLQKTFNPLPYPILNYFSETFKRTLNIEEFVEEDEIFISQMHDYMRYPTVTIENVKVGHQINVVPYYAEATIEIRTLPFQSREDVERILEYLFRKNQVDWEIISFQQGYESDITNEALEQLEETCREKDFLVKLIPFTALGKTDGRFISQMATNIYGISPVKISFTEVLKRVHNTNERIELDSFEWGTSVLFDTITFIARKEVHKNEYI
jgi:acetylornithine deacetylase/succinyl-diaminopimelate desuccinylase-like protein